MAPGFDAAEDHPKTFCKTKLEYVAEDVLEEGGLPIYVHFCSWCHLRRILPFDLRSSFVCQDAGLTCKAGAASQVEDELFECVCERCGLHRFLPFQLGQEFLCRDVDLECGSEVTSRGKDAVCNRCGHCNSERVLPFDFGDDFVCADAGFDCAYNGEGFDEEGSDDNEEEEIFDNVCGQCGAIRPLPFDLRGSFVCGVAGLECGGDELQLNSCVCCGKKRMCPFKVDDFVCGGCDAKALRRYEEIEPPAAQEESEDDGLDDATREAMRRDNERINLLWKVLIQDVSLLDAAAFFKEHGHEAPTQEELLDLRSNTLNRFRGKTTGNRAAMRAALKSKNKGGSTKRYLNSELVTVSKKDKYLREAKESAEDKAKTSVELYIIGIGRGGRHCVKLKMDDTKKKGPMSNKHNK